LQVISDSHPAFRIDLLSGRERQVLDLAVAGKTDDQIAKALEITTSTVNSYWVRIRGKVGQLSRTEIVGNVLRSSAGAEIEVLQREVSELRSRVASMGSQLAQTIADNEARIGTSWHLLALHHAPDAMLVARHPGNVAYANLQAQRLFSSSPGAMVGCAVCELTIPLGREERRTKIREFLGAKLPQRLIVGIDEPCYCVRADGDNFRAVVSIQGFVAPEEFMAVLTVREYLGEAEQIVRSLRQPTTTTH